MGLSILITIFAFAIWFILKKQKDSNSPTCASNEIKSKLPESEYSLDEIEAIKYRAQNGDIAKQFSLGVLYHSGTGVVQNYEEAIKWFMAVAQKWHTGGQYFVASYYNEGLGGLEHDEQKAYEWFLKAAEQGMPDAQVILGIIHSFGTSRDDLTEAFKWFSMAAKQGDALGQYHVGVSYYNGIGVPQNIELGIEYLEMAADKECPEAQKLLGTVYFNGRGVMRDRDKGMSLIYRAAKNGDAEAIELWNEMT